MTDNPKSPGNVVTLHPAPSVDYLRFETIITSPETGDVEVAQEAEGWRVDHVCYYGDHAGNIAHGLPTRLDAIRSGLQYALSILRPTRPAA
jgi:hypothetical protein